MKWCYPTRVNEEQCERENDDAGQEVPVRLPWSRRLGLCVSSNERQTALLAGHAVALLRQACAEAAEINKRVTYHTFRHTFGTLLNANGENPKVVQELLRHASLKVTTDVYMQAVSPQKREAQSKLVKMVMKKTVSA